jgi:hypothetical protein
MKTILLISQDTGREILINSTNIVIIEDLGSYRVVVYKTTNSGSISKIYVKESIRDIQAKVENI